MSERTLSARARPATAEVEESSAEPTVTPISGKGQSLQDQFLNLLRKNKVPVTMFLVKGVKLQGIVTLYETTSTREVVSYNLSG